jgi:hypothetical protein
MQLHKHFRQFQALPDVTTVMDAAWTRVPAASAGAPLLPSLPYAQALCLLAVTQLAGALYLHALSPHLRPGGARLLAALPVVAVPTWRRRACSAGIRT